MRDSKQTEIGFILLMESCWKIGSGGGVVNPTTGKNSLNILLILTCLGFSYFEDVFQFALA